MFLSNTQFISIYTLRLTQYRDTIIIHLIYTFNLTVRIQEHRCELYYSCDITKQLLFYLQIKTIGLDCLEFGKPIIV